MPVLGFGAKPLPFNSPIFITENSQQNNAEQNSAEQSAEQNTAEQSAQQSATAPAPAPAPAPATATNSFEQLATANGQCLKQGDNYWLPPTANGDLFDQNHSYRWGTGVYGDWDSAIDYANTNSLCGFSDWRIATAAELQQLHTTASSFSNLQTIMPNILNQGYWSSDSNDNNTAIAVNLNNGLLTDVAKHSYLKLILLRAEQ